MPHIPPGYCNVQIGGSNSTGNDWLSACGSVIEAWDPSDMVGVFGSFLATATYPTDVMSGNYEITFVRVIVGTSNPSAPITYEETGSRPGGGGEGAAPQCAFLVRKLTALGGRKGRGRSYLPGVSEASLDDNGLYVGQVASDPTVLTDFWPDLLTYLNLGPAVLLHDDPLDDPNEITAFVLDQKVATQRNRLR